ncbi:MAG: hypothetical protein K0S44_856 [Bacteroidetes bacterium]|jgi:hypothetical protein|nr:hypothetical protein [Bacteroidota bacterium]
MEQYKKNNSGTSGVEFYEIENKDIIVQFIDGSIYKYTYNSAGEEAVEKMKELALAGKGLTTYINQFVKDKYEAKLKESNY